MTIPEESRTENPSAPAGVWHRRHFQAPANAPWVPRALEKLTGQPAMPALRALQTDSIGGWSVEEFVASDRLPLADYLTNSAAPVWVFVSIVQQCLTGLIALHRHGLWHGAISPRSLLVDPSGQVILAGCGAGSEAPPWPEGMAAFTEAPPLPHTLPAADLRDLGRVFRAVLGGDPDIRMTESRPDIAPLVAEWIDWLANPAPGREPSSAAQAESVFADIRTGRSGWRPWRMQSDVPADAEYQPPAPTEKERRRLARRSRLGHGGGLEWRGVMVFGLLMLGVLTGGAWVVHHFLSAQTKEKQDEESLTLTPSNGEALPALADDDPADYSASGGDIEPLPDTAENIAKLIKMLSDKPGDFPDWTKELDRQREERDRLAKGEPPGADSRWLHDPVIFPVMGKPSAGRAPGDYYLVWRTEQVILTPVESLTLQSAILRSARFCGTRVMTWTVIPNHAAVVLRVPPRQPLADEKLERRIAILRGEKIAAGVMAKVNAKLKAGDQEGAENERRLWTGSMGSAAGFYGVVKSLRIIEPDGPVKGDLWPALPLHLSILNPDTPDLLRAAAIVDTAAVNGRLVTSASAWPTCGLTAAMLNYGPALRAFSVLMQRNPRASLPLPPKEELLSALRSYRRYLGDLPPEQSATALPPAASSAKN